MAENTNSTVVEGTVVDTPEKKPNFLVRLKNRFPRASKVLAIIAGLLALFGVGFAVAAKGRAELSDVENTDDTEETYTLSDPDSTPASEA